MKNHTKELIKMKLIDAAIPATVGITMVLITYLLVGKVRAEILGIAEQAALNAVDKAFVRTEPAIEWHGAETLTPVVKIGSILEIRYTAVVKHQCPADVRAFLIDTSFDSASFRFPDQMGGYRHQMPEEQTWSVRVLINDPPAGSGLPPLNEGTYKYRATAIRYCERIELDSSIPDAEFKLIR